MNTSSAVFDASDLGQRSRRRPTCFGRLALEYATRFHVSVLPLLVDGGAPVSEVPGGSKDASRDPATIQAWWTRAPHANVGIACAASGLLVLKVDPLGGGLETLAMHARRLGPLPFTWTARDFDGGTQRFFSHDDPDVLALPKLRPLGRGVEVTHRGYVLAPPSVFQGRSVAWHPEGRPGNAPLAPMPKAWLDRLARRRLRNGSSGLASRPSLAGRAFEHAPVPETLQWAARELLSDLGIDLAWEEA